jgi:hypothetical protein
VIYLLNTDLVSLMAMHPHVLPLTGELKGSKISVLHFIWMVDELVKVILFQ